MTFTGEGKAVQNDDSHSFAGHSHKKRREQRRRQVFQAIAFLALLASLVLVVWQSEDPRYGPTWKWAGVALATAILLVYAYVTVAQLNRRRRAKRRNR